MMTKKKSNTVAMNNGNANANVSAESVPLWEESGWTVVQPKTAPVEDAKNDNPEGE